MQPHNPDLAANTMAAIDAAKRLRPELQRMEGSLQAFLNATRRRVPEVDLTQPALERAWWLIQLDEHRGNIAAVARALNTSRMSIYRTLRKLGIGRSFPQR